MKQINFATKPYSADPETDDESGHGEPPPIKIPN